MSFESLKELTDLMDSDLEFLTQKCFSEAEEVEGHVFYKGVDWGTYAKITLIFRNTRYQM